mmetsp:Transcript_42886/g.98385  ORF Transcript_42886/g.98385 Transcript_42886/m.98385 type:complete len:214 (+) Transcript_42886:1939-2580(+)
MSVSGIMPQKLSLRLALQSPASSGIPNLALHHCSSSSMRLIMTTGTSRRTATVVAMLSKLSSLLPSTTSARGGTSDNTSLGSLAADSHRSVCDTSSILFTRLVRPRNSASLLNSVRDLSSSESSTVNFSGPSRQKFKMCRKWRPSLSKKYAPSYAACFCLSNLGNTESGGQESKVCRAVVNTVPPTLILTTLPAVSPPQMPPHICSTAFIHAR